MRRTYFLVVIAASLAVQPSLHAQSGRAAVPCETGNGGLSLPAGFCAAVVVDAAGPARHLAVAANGDIYVALRNAPNAPGGVLALRDTNGDGKADVREKFGDSGGTGLVLHEGFLYLAQDTAVVRFPMKAGQLLPTGPAEVVVGGFPQQRVHPTKTLAFDARGGLYVNVGLSSNACTEPDQAKVPGISPCTQLDTGGGIWRFEATRTGQQFGKDGRRYSTGLRQANAMGWNGADNSLYLMQHGRGGLNRWTEFYTTEESADQPSEELQRITDGANYGFPYCYWDIAQGKRVLAPEYGGDGKKTGDCAKYPAPAAAFPAHWAPNDLLFYTGRQFPAKYTNGVLVAFHGGGSRAPLPEGGYKVVFQPLRDGKAAGAAETFADGFAGTPTVMKREEAAARPMGLAQGPDGSLYVADSVKGRIWRISYTGR